MPKGHKIPYSKAELAWIKAHATWPRRKAHAEFCRRFGRDDVTLGGFKQLCTRRGWRTGRTGCFKPGLATWNKGAKMPFNANSARTRFRKGNRPHTLKYLGHERVCAEGYVWISVAETNPYTGYERRYVEKHRHLWERRNGPVPEGWCLKSLDGDRTNTDPSNWIAIPRALLPRLNGRYGRDYDTAPPDLKPVILATARLAQKAWEARKNSTGGAS